MPFGYISFLLCAHHIQKMTHSNCIYIYGESIGHCVYEREQKAAVPCMLNGRRMTLFTCIGPYLGLLCIMVIVSFFRRTIKTNKKYLPKTSERHRCCQKNAVGPRGCSIHLKTVSRSGGSITAVRPVIEHGRCQGGGATAPVPCLCFSVALPPEEIMMVIKCSLATIHIFRCD